MRIKRKLLMTTGVAMTESSEKKSKAMPDWEFKKYIQAWMKKCEKIREMNEDNEEWKQSSARRAKRNDQKKDSN